VRDIVVSDYLKKNWIAILALIAVIVAVSLNRPVKVSVLENVYIEVGSGEAGPPAVYDEVIELPDGRKVYISGDSCRIEE